MNRYALAHRIWLAAAAPATRRFRRALGDPARSQRRLLRDYLRANADTDFGRRHRFASIDGVRAFRRRVPLSTFDAYAGEVERIRGGARGVLTRESVRRLVPSSGSSGARKLIPHTPTLTAEFNRAVNPWIADLHARDPALRQGPAYWSISPQGTAATESSAVPIGFDDDGDYLGGAVSRLVESLLAVPAAVREAEAPEPFRYLTLHALLRARELRLVSVWHPSFVELLLDPLDSHWQRLLEDIGSGTLHPPEPLAPDLARRLARRLRPDPERARELAALGPGNLPALWPRLGWISAWSDAHASGASSSLTRRFPGVRLQPKGLLGTEAVISVPFANRRPLAIRSHVFEFLDDVGRPHAADELRVGAEYAVVVTTGGGLYRYRTGDRIRVDGTLAATPTVLFAGRDDQVSDRRGEKLADAHVAGVLERLLTSLSPRPAFAMLAPDGDRPPGYTLYIECSTSLPGRLAERLDRALMQNPHYRQCLDLGQLAPLRIFRIREGAQTAYLERRRREGQRLGDVKPQALATDGGWSTTFVGSYERHPSPASR